MSKIIDLLEKARFELPVLSTNIPTRKLIGEALELLEQQPTAGEWTKKVRAAMIDNGREHSGFYDTRKLFEACDRLDRAEATKKDLLELCEEFMEIADDGSARFDDPEPGSIYLRAEAAIAKAKQVGE